MKSQMNLYVAVAKKSVHWTTGKGNDARRRMLEKLLLQQESSEWQWKFTWVLSSVMIAREMEMAENDIIYVR